MTQPLRIGALGAARITPVALVEPAHQIDGIAIRAIAARDSKRACVFARMHSIPKVVSDYAALVESDEIDIVYNALPIAYHCEWSIRALRAGKHVLCEKTLAQNAEEASLMRDAARDNDRHLVEALHYRYHPLMQRVLDLLRGGAIGAIESLASHFYFSMPRDETDIRWVYELGGGCTMEMGCYPIHMVRTAMGEEPEVGRAKARTGPPNIDIRMEAELHFPGDIRGHIACAMGPEVEQSSAALKICGSRGVLQVQNPLVPHLGHTLIIERDRKHQIETVGGETTYLHQLRAFVACVREGAAMPTGADDAVANLHVIDAVYRAAGLTPRGLARNEPLL